MAAEEVGKKEGKKEVKNEEEEKENTLGKRSKQLRAPERS